LSLAYALTSFVATTGAFPRSDHPVAGLARAKEQLRRRLTRRGWALSAAAVTTILTDKALAVPLPAGLVASTLAYVTGKSANTGALAAKVSDGVLRMMWLNKMKMAAGVVLAVVLAGTGVGLVVRKTWAGGGCGLLRVRAGLTNRGASWRLTGGEILARTSQRNLTGHLVSGISPMPA
jgi:hypothetical protein